MQNSLTGTVDRKLIRMMQVIQKYAKHKTLKMAKLKLENNVKFLKLINIKASNEKKNSREKLFAPLVDMSSLEKIPTVK